MNDKDKTSLIFSAQVTPDFQGPLPETSFWRKLPAPDYILLDPDYPDEDGRIAGWTGDCRDGETYGWVEYVKLEVGQAAVSQTRHQCSQIVLTKDAKIIELMEEVECLTRERDAANSRAKGNWKHLSRLWDLAKGYDPDDDEEGPRCRDCADENGRCPHSGFPCDPQEEAEERIRKMFAASSTEPAAPSVSAAAKVLLESKTVSVLIAAGKKIDAEELLSARAAKENSNEQLNLF